MKTRLSGRYLTAKFRRTICILALLAASTAAFASEYHGTVSFGGLPVPGATVTVTQGGRKYVTVTDTQGFYTFPTLADGPASIEIQMTGFETLKQDVTVAADAPLAKLELKLLTLDAMVAALKPVPSAPYTETQTRSEVVKTAETPRPAANQPAPPPQSEETTNRANDGLLVNGSVNNAATSQFSLAPRFGNTASGKSLYSYGLYVRAENSALDAQSYSLSGVQTSKPQTNLLTGGLSFQGPIKIPHILRNGPNIFINYQRTENSQSNIVAGLLPDALGERTGDFSHETNVPTLLAPANISAACIGAGVTPGAAFTGNVIPTACISQQALALLKLFPTPNITGSTIYNYQQPLVTDTHQDALSSNVSKTIGRKNQVTGNFGLQSSRTSYQNLFNFTDATNGLGINANAVWNHTYNAHFRTTLTYTFSRQSNRLTPFWQNHQGTNYVSPGADQDPTFAGPPSINFTSGIYGLSDGNASFSRNESNQGGYVVRWNHFAHNVTGGADFNRREFNYLSQSNPRGTLTFSAANPNSSGFDLADFLLGNPYTSQINYGNADKYLRQNIYDAYVTDDWRVNPTLTVNVGARWEYGAPITEIKNRLTNLNVAPGFTSVASVLYPQKQLQPDRSGFEPRIAASWRPIPGSSTVVSAGYGITYDTSVYQGIALNLAQQPPLLTALVNAQTNYGTCPTTLTLGNAFTACPLGATFGIDPGFRVGYLSTWNLKVQRDLPGSLQMVVTYLGNKGTRGLQLFLPNTNPAGSAVCTVNCPPNGFEYLTSTGNSTRESGQVQLRRRLKSGFTASALYTYSKSIDDDSALGGQGGGSLASASIAQDWRHLNAERGLSTFDQRHLLNASLQYTTGMGMGGGSLLAGWRGKAYKEWTFLTTITAGSGNPITPLAEAIAVAGYTGSVRPNVTGVPLYSASGGRYVNPLAFSTPAAGQWGNARRDSITGPNEFSLSATMQRTFRITPRYNLDAQILANNALNHVSFNSYYNNINSTQFGFPTSPSTMRQVILQLRLRF